MSYHHNVELNSNGRRSWKAWGKLSEDADVINLINARKKLAVLSIGRNWYGGSMLYDEAQELQMTR